MQKRHFIAMSWVAFLLASVHLDARALPAGYQTYPTDSELSSLPPFCRVKLRGSPTSAEWQSALASFGADFGHVHHYCTGLNFINRSYRTSDVQEKRFYLQSAVSELGYMFTHAKPDFVLMPDIYLNQALAYSLMKDRGNAIIDLEKAISLNHGLAKAYIMLADLQMDLKLRSDALRTVTEGLHYVPNSNSLKKRYVELGGKLPYPEPSQRPEDQKPVADEKGRSNEIESRQATEPGQSSSAEPAGVQPDVNPPKIGVPGNPWCRFCAEPADPKADQPQAKP
jgi:tetratricopeptide (TPR) repeat protein